MESPEWSQRGLRVYKDLAEENRGHDHHDHEAKFTKTSSRHTFFSLRTSWVLGDRDIFHIYPVLFPSILGYPFYPDSGTNFFRTTLEMSQPSSFPVSVIIIN